LRARRAPACDAEQHQRHTELSGGGEFVVVDLAFRPLDHRKHVVRQHPRRDHRGIHARRDLSPPCGYLPTSREVLLFQVS
jgi:hypothetical protein